MSIVRLQLHVVFVCLGACSADLEEADVQPLLAPDEAEVVAREFELPPACEGWRSLGPGEEAAAELHLEYDEEVQHLRSRGAGPCMRATLAALADDPPEGPLSLHLGSDTASRELPPVEPRLDADARDSFRAKIRALMRDVERDAAHCSAGPARVRLKIAVEGPRGTVISAELYEPSDHPAEACLVEATLGREIGGLPDERPLHAIFPVELD